MTRLYDFPPVQYREVLPMAPTATRRKTTRQKSNRPKATRRKATRYWSGRVNAQSNALDLERGFFSLKDPKRIAASLRRSGEQSRRRKAEPYRSELSMLVFYMN